ncbi:2317_t:CDS:2, partial [Dentiscutata erythropus]
GTIDLATTHLPCLFMNTLNNKILSTGLIMNDEQGKRHDKANLLYDNYKKKSKNLLLKVLKYMELRSDKKKANNWEREHLKKQVYIYYQISSSETVYGRITNNRTNNYIALDKNEESVGL